jgi:multiple sugar transport system substrate-binding protein/sn-glycerol 3-phosphate transport system substrate-binding protein
MNTKRMWMLATLLVAALVLAACPTPVAEAPAAMEEEASASEAMDEGPCAPAMDGPLAGIDPRGQTIVWWHQHSGSREEKLAVIVEDFNTNNECGIVLDAQNQGGYNDIRDKVNASTASGEQPASLIVGYQNDQAFYQLNEVLADFDKFIDDPTWGLSAEERADYFASFVEQGVHPVFDGQRLGFPPNRSMEVLYYNLTWLEELGFSGPPTTPEEFEEMACAAAEANGDGTGGYILRDDASATASWTFAFGGDVLNEDNTGYVYNSQATIDSMTMLKRMLDNGCAYFFTEGYPNPEFAARRASFTQGSSSGLPFYANDMVTIAEEQGREMDVWGVTAIPHTTEDPVQNIYGADVMITAGQPEQELAAWLFIKWFTSPEVQARWVEASNYFPTRAGTAAHLTGYVEQNPQYGEALALLGYGAYEPQLISYQAVRDAAQTAFNEIMQGGDIQATLDALTETANDLQEELMGEVQ